jgi:hypothetical protein
LLKFIGNQPEDRRSFIGIGGFVDARLAKRPDGRVGPMAVAAKFSQAASSTRQLAASVSGLQGFAADEWRLLKTDLLCASWLGDYYANQIRGLTYLDYARKTGRQPEYETSLQNLAEARQAWKALGEVVDGTYGLLNNHLRHQTNFHWSNQLTAIDRLDAAAAQLWASNTVKAGAIPLTLTAADKGEDSGLRIERLEHRVSKSKDAASISCHPKAKQQVAKVLLWFKPLPSETAWQSTEMTEQPDGSFSATIPLTSEGLMYSVEVRDKTGQAENFPLVFRETPYRTILPFAYQTSANR